MSIELFEEAEEPELYKKVADLSPDIWQLTDDAYLDIEPDWGELSP